MYIDANTHKHFFHILKTPFFHHLHAQKYNQQIQ